MRDFNTVRHELINHLRLSWQGEDGVIRWYSRTPELLMEIMGFLFDERKPENDSRNEP